jgi:hypothetical protein
MSQGGNRWKSAECFPFLMAEAARNKPVSAFAACDGAHQISGS